MTTPPLLPAMRVKNQWFKGDAPRSPAEQASAMAFILWRAARQVLERMRGADFDIDAGRPYFAFLRELLVFLIAVTDRIAYQRLGADERHAFTVALVGHVARTLQDNEDSLLGAPAAGTPAQTRPFIDLVNEVVGHYAEFGADPSPPAQAQGLFHPDFGFVRYLGARLEPTLPEKDRLWVLDQIMAVQAPEALAIVQRSMRSLLDPAGPQRPRRGATSGD